jgi:very-short-patch-repair endonuclease
MSRFCPTCHSALTLKQPKYCDAKCYHASNVKPIREFICQQCGQACQRPSSGKVKRKFCKRSCYLAHRAADVIEKYCTACTQTFTVSRVIAHRFTVCSRTCRRSTTRYPACLRCGNQFTATNAARKYCSELCRRPIHNIACAHCLKIFRIGPSDTKRLFCSFACYRRFRGETQLEKVVRLELERLKIGFRQEAKMGRYSVDFILPDANIALEIDGNYWHRNKARDARKNTFLCGAGLTVIRVSETAIQTLGVSRALRRVLSKSRHSKKLHSDMTGGLVDPRPETSPPQEPLSHP